MGSTDHDRMEHYFVSALGNTRTVRSDGGFVFNPPRPAAAAHAAATRRRSVARSPVPAVIIVGLDDGFLNGGVDVDDQITRHLDGHRTASSG